MNWKLKATIQNAIDCLPSSLAYPVYYKIQRIFGSLRNISPHDDFIKSVLIIKNILNQNREVTGKTFFELGTGRTLNVPIGLWLCGASKVITVDINPYLKEQLIMESLFLIKKHKYEIYTTFYGLLIDNRLNRLMLCYNYRQLLDLINIEYHAPADASSLPIDDNTIDYYCSLNVLEHIPLDVIKKIIKESERILTVDGLLVHFIDLSDHFSHDDKYITSINFLQFNEIEWTKWAGNRFMYHNRLRLYDYYELFNHHQIEILDSKIKIDIKALDMLLRGFPVDNRFVNMPPEELSVSSLHIVGKFRKEAQTNHVPPTKTG